MARRNPPPTDSQVSIRNTEDGLMQALEGLAVGESVARGARIPLDDFTIDVKSDWFKRTSGLLSSYVHRAKHANPKRSWVMERCESLAKESPHVLTAIIITRTE